MRKGTADNTHLSRTKLGFYGVLTLPFAMINMPVAAYLPPFYTQDLGISLATVGFIVMAARMSDIITDPLIGLLSDRIHFRFGRRRPWIIMGLPIMMLSSYMLFLPVPPVGSLYLLVWIALLYLGWTFMAIPYTAWGAELSDNYHERSRVTAARQVFQVTGMFLAGGIPVCHGSGGIAGHYTFGGRTGGSTFIYGLFYLLLGLFLSNNNPEILHIFPKPILGVILLFEGIALIILVKDIITEKKSFFIAVLVAICANGLPNGYFIGMLIGTLIYYFSDKFLLKHYGKQ